MEDFEEKKMKESIIVNIYSGREGKYVKYVKSIVTRKKTLP